MNWFKKIYLKITGKSEDQDYRLVPLEEVEGVKFFRFDNELQTPYCRTARVMIAFTDKENIGLHRNDLTKALDLIMEANRKGDRDSIATVINTLKAYMTQEVSDSILFNLAEPLILLEGESIDKIDAKATMRKKELCESSEVIKGFFLKMGFVFLYSLLNSSIGHLEVADYFNNKEQRRIERIFSQLIHKNYRQIFVRK
jgi:hypothetical protein